jgi:signal transduction histidine kinase/ActR/RegA family two-component response regulator
MSDSSEQERSGEMVEEALLEQGKRIRALHEIISRPDISFDQQIDETLRLGCRLLHTEIGKLGRQDPEKNKSEFLNTIVMSDLTAKRGMVLPLDKTFCNVTFSSLETIAISHVAESEFKYHPAAQFLGMQSYIGCSIHVHGKKFGTVNFANRTPVKKPFTEADKDLVNLIGSWISVMMERQLEAEELKKMKEAAESANQAKSAFLANMSHEIRTPLTSIIGFADVALDNEQSEAQHLHALQTIRRSSDHLLNLINEILDFSKIEAGELDIEKSTVHITQIVTEVESIVRGQATNKGLDFTVDYAFPLPDKIQSDSLRIKQILLNLCNNAIKFTDSGSVRMLIRHDAVTNILSFVVKDTGIGMTPDQTNKIFKPFKQADASTSRRFGGTGLGLSLSKRLAKLLNGELEVSSEIGTGSVFTLSFKLDASENPQPQLTHGSNEVKFDRDNGNVAAVLPLLTGEILLAEDNDLNQQLIMMYLEKIGARVTLACNGAIAVTLAQQHTYDLIYMDMQMPIMSGSDAVKKLRESHYSGPIVMLTANATLEDRKLCKQAGSNDFLTKPIVRQKLYDVTATYLKRAATAVEAKERQG